MVSSTEKDALVRWYLDELDKNLRIKDDIYKEQIMDQVRPSLVEISNKVHTKKELIRTFGDPRSIARELSDPKNWVVDLGSPLSPQKEIKPFFSSKGRLILTMMFTLGFAIPIGIFLLRPETGWVLPGVLISFEVIWAIGLAFLNNYLGYLGTAWSLKGSNMSITTIDYSNLKKHILIFCGSSILISFLLGTCSIFLDPAVLSVSIPVTTSTIAATIISARMMHIEGKKVLS